MASCAAIQKLPRPICKKKLEKTIHLNYSAALEEKGMYCIGVEEEGMYYI